MVEIIISGSGVTAAVVAARMFSIWWKGRVHRQNVDRVCASMEKLAETGCLVGDAGEMLQAIDPNRGFAIGRVTRAQRAKLSSLEIVAVPGAPERVGHPVSNSHRVDSDSSIIEIPKEVGPAATCIDATLRR